jgi:hypothetical protein
MRWRGWAAGLAVAAVVAAVFAPATLNGFVLLDDPVYVTENPVVLGGLSAEGIVWAFTTLDGGLWLPATWLSLQLDATVHDTGPFGFHLTNVLLHAANAGLLFHVLRRATGSTGRSAAAALLWAVHPLRVESVAWVCERKDVLSGLFFLLTVAAYLRYTRTPARRWYYLALGLYCVGLAAKPMIVTTPCVLLLLDAWPLGRLRSARDLGRLAWEKAPFFLLSAVFAVITTIAQTDAWAVHSWADRPAGERVDTMLTGYGTYLWLTVWPSGLAGMQPLGPVPPWKPAAAAVVLAGLTAAAVALRRRAPYLLVGWLWFVGVLFPVSGVSQAGAQAYADRFTYLPHIGLVVAVVWGAAAVFDRFRSSVPVRWLTAAVVVAACVVQTERQIPHWADGRAFWERVVAVNPDLPHLRLTLAQTYMKEGDYDRALAEADEACRLADYDPGFLMQRWVMQAVADRKRAGGR